MENWAKFNKQISTKLNEVEGPFLAGQNLTIADMVIASLYWSQALNTTN